MPFLSSPYLTTLFLVVEPGHHFIRRLFPRFVYSSVHLAPLRRHQLRRFGLCHRHGFLELCYSLPLHFSNSFLGEIIN